MDLPVCPMVDPAAALLHPALQHNGSRSRITWGPPGVNAIRPVAARISVSNAIAGYRVHPSGRYRAAARGYRSWHAATKLSSWGGWLGCACVLYRFIGEGGSGLYCLRGHAPKKFNNSHAAWVSSTLIFGAENAKCNKRIICLHLHSCSCESTIQRCNDRKIAEGSI